MDYKEHIRKKDGGLQAILSYKEGRKWKQKSKQGFEDSKKGEKKAQQWMHDMLNQLENDLHLNRNYKNITFKNFTDMYIEDRKANLSDNTIATFDTAFKKFSDLNNLELKKITTMDIQRCVNKMSNANARESSIKTHISKLKTAFNYAVNKYSIISVSPVKDIEFKGEKSGIKVALNKVEVNKLLDNVKKSHSVKYYIITLLAVKCGLRIGEILGLTWDKIDFKNCMLEINIQWNKIDGSYGFAKLKSNNSYRKVPFNNLVKSELLHYKNSNVININNKLFNLNNTKSLSTYLRNIYIKAGFDITIHELRHTYATNLIYNGLDLKTVAKLLGHDIEQTMKTYSHVNDDMMNEAINIINKI